MTTIFLRLTGGRLTKTPSTTSAISLRICASHSVCTCVHKQPHTLPLPLPKKPTNCNTALSLQKSGSFLVGGLHPCACNDDTVTHFVTSVPLSLSLCLLSLSLSLLLTCYLLFVSRPVVIALILVSPRYSTQWLLGNIGCVTLPQQHLNFDIVLEPQVRAGPKCAPPDQIVPQT